MYEVIAERPRGRFGVLTRRTNLGQINKGQTETFGYGSNVVELTLDEHETLVIKSNGEDPIKVKFAAEPNMRCTTDVVAFLGPHNSETRTGRSKVTITPLNRGRDRLVLEGPDRHPLTLTAGEVKAMEMGIDAMRGNVTAAFKDGVKKGVFEGYNKGYSRGADTGYRAGRVVQETNL